MALTRTETLAPEPVEALAGLLDIDPPHAGEVPPLWHWLYLLERPPERALGEDGHPTAGIPAPPGPGRRRMFAGGRVDTHRLLRLGEPATRRTTVASTAEKQGRSGTLTFVTVRHEIEQLGHLAVTEEQDIVYRTPGPALPAPAVPEPAAVPARLPSLRLEVDSRLLFRFSALTYNTHRIHYDQEWARREGYDDLVVHGPLQALLMGELMRRSGIPLTGSRYSYRLVAPVVGAQTLTAMAGSGGMGEGCETRSGPGILTAVSTREALATPRAPR
jgi:3-methylfumaryl-CoA hydratase